MGSLLIGFIFPIYPTNAQCLDWDLENLKSKTTPQVCFCVLQIIPEPFFQRGRVHYLVERGHCHPGTYFHEWYIWSKTMFTKVVHMKVTSTWITEPKVSQKNIKKNLIASDRFLLRASCIASSWISFKYFPNDVSSLQEMHESEWEHKAPLLSPKGALVWCII